MDPQWLVSAFATFLNISQSEVRIKSIEPGTVRILIEIPEECVQRVVEALASKNPDLAKLLTPLNLAQIQIRSQSSLEDLTLRATPFDVFLSHNGMDKPSVRSLAEALRTRGLKVWFDEWELPPGQPWQECVEKVIKTVKSAAIIVGGSGLGPWEKPEMRLCLQECVNRHLPVSLYCYPAHRIHQTCQCFSERLRGWICEVACRRKTLIA